MPRPYNAVAGFLSGAEESEPGYLLPLEEVTRTLAPIEMAALITASVEFWKFRVQREGPFGADFPTICDVALDLYAAIKDIPFDLSPTELLDTADFPTESESLAPVVLAAAIAATVEVWRSSAEDFFGYRHSAAPRRRPIEAVAAEVRAAIDVLNKPLKA